MAEFLILRLVQEAHSSFIRVCSNRRMEDESGFSRLKEIFKPEFNEK